MSRPVTEYEVGPFQALGKTELGEKLWEFLNRTRNVDRMDTATDLGNPAVAGIEEQLLHEFGAELLDDRVKQMIGHMVRQVMTDEGYEVEQKNVKIGSALFSKGTRYRRPDWQRLHVFRSTKDARKLCFAASRDTDPLPGGGGQWRYWASFATILRGHIAYGIDVRQVRNEVDSDGYALRPLTRLVGA